MRLIDADAMKEKTYCRAKHGMGNTLALMFKIMIDEQPTIDAVQVVRCKDCKFWQDQEEGVIEVPICARPENKYEKLPFRFMIGKDGFCSFGERRSNETDRCRCF